MYEISSKSHVDETGNLYFDVSIKKEDDTVVEKRLPIAQYLELFMSNCVEKECFVTVPSLPKEVLACRVSSERPDTFEAVILYPAKERAFSYCGQHFLLPFPALIASVGVRAGVRSHTDLFALATDEPTEDTPLMEYPYGNVRSDGGCCYGGILVEGLKDASDACAVLDAFLCGGTNNDLYHMQNTKGLSQGELVEMMRKESVFPLEMLVPTIGENMTVGKLTKKFKTKKEEVAY